MTTQKVRRHRNTALTFAVVLALGFGGAAIADESGLYIGASAVRTLNTLSRGTADSALASEVQAASGESLSISSSSLTDSAVSWSALVGYRFFPFLEVEASYLDLGHLTYNAAGTAGSDTVSSALRISSKGPTLALVGVLPLLDALEISARAGAFEGKTTTEYANTFDANVDSGTASKTSTSLLLGVGASYALSGHLAVRVDYVHLNRLQEQVLGQSFNVDLVSAGLTFMF